MKTLTFYGASDDLIEVDGYIREEYNHCSDRPFHLIVVDESGNSLRVTGMYSPDNDSACWMFGLSQLEEDYPIPKSWDIIFKTHERSRYSGLLQIDVPDECGEITIFKEGEEPNE